MRKSKYEGKFKLNDKIGRWTVIDEKLVLNSINREASILVECKCKTQNIVRCSTLIQGRSTGCNSCGHSKKGEESVRFSGYKEIPGRWFTRFANGVGKKEVKITIEDIYKLWIKQNKQCALSGLPIDFINTNEGNERKGSKYDLICTASLDRIDSSKGYIKGNIQLVHKDVNIMKNEYEQERFIEICKLVTKNNK